MSATLSRTRRRGEPVVVLAAIAAAWIAVRLVLWQSPLIDAPLAAAGDMQPIFAATPTHIEVTAVPSRTDDSALPRLPAKPEARSHSAARHAIAPLGYAHAALLQIPATHAAPAMVPLPPVPQANPLATLHAPNQPVAIGLAEVSKVRTWHFDAWVAWRLGGPRTGVAGQPLTLAYGGSQAGIVTRYDLAEGERQPQAYLRVVHAPDRPSQSDLALGLGARPIARVPVRLQAEARATRSQGDTFVRTALLAVSELPPIELPFGFRGEGYGQAGWVGGRYATGFVDGQVRLDRDVAAIGGTRVRMGAGAWGGAQKFVERLDVGPTVMLDLSDTAVPARLSVDYRQRVAGNARPGNGVAVTLSTGF